MALSSQTLTVLQGTFGPGVAEELARLSTQIYVSADGKVGIGNTSPGAYALNVTGSVLVGSLGVTGDAAVTGQFTTSPSNTTRAGLRIAVGEAPSSPVDGDVWITATGMFVRVDGTTEQVTFNA